MSGPFATGGGRFNWRSDAVFPLQALRWYYERSQRMHRTAPAKINLGLHVLRKRTDGYHDIETVFIRLPWADVLHAEPADDLRLTCSDSALPVDDSNLVMKAARRLREALGSAVGGNTPMGGVRTAGPETSLRGAHIHLEKHLPAGAGLGGGSSDAAAALLLLNDLWDAGRSRDELAEIAARIGSDVPFFLGAEAAIGTGRGEVLEPLIDPETDEPYRPPFVLVVAVPPIAISTAEAYKMVEPRSRARANLRNVVLSNDLDRWRDNLVNDFEAPIVERYPAIHESKSALVQAGAGYASLSGSGAAVYGFFTSDDTATGAAEALRETGHRVWHGRL